MTTSGKRRSTYRLSRQEYADLLKITVCSICSRQVPLVIDHDHQSGRVRGMLCSRCNRALGMLGDSMEGLQRATAYLSSH